MAPLDTGHYSALPIDALNVDHSYQRDLNADLVQKIKAKWDPVTAGAILVSRRADGSLWVVDGAHRTAAAKLSGETMVLSQVLEGLDPMGEAERRLSGNVKRGDSPAERFKAQVKSGWPESLAIMELVENFGTKINFAGVDAKRGINAIGTVEDLYRRNKGILLSRVFEMLRDTFGQIGGPTATVNLMKGLGWLIERHDGEMDRGRMIERIGKEGVAGLDRKARTTRAAMGGALWMNYYRTFIEIYNERLPQSARLEWRTGGYTSEGGSGWET